MQIEALLTNKRTLCHASCTSKKKALEILAHLIAEGTDNIDADDLFHQFFDRERLGSTGLGSGIAIPHCRFKTSGATVGALMTLETPIDFDSIDSKPVDVVFAMLVPEDTETDHLQNLAVLAERLQDKNFVNSLRNASNQNDLYNAALAS